MKKTILFILTMILIAGCRTTTSFMKPPINRPSDDASIKLAEAAASVSSSMLDMAKIEKVIYAPPQKKSNIPNAYPLQVRASIDWSGPISELLESVAKAAHYRVQVMGKPPAVPILITLNSKDDSLVTILRNIDYQAGQQANIYVYPNTQVIELRYAKLDL